MKETNRYGIGCDGRGDPSPFATSLFLKVRDRPRRQRTRMGTAKQKRYMQERQAEYQDGLGHVVVVMSRLLLASLPLELPKWTSPRSPPSDRPGQIRKPLTGLPCLSGDGNTLHVRTRANEKTNSTQMEIGNETHK